MLISSFLEIDFVINISDKKSRRFDLSEVIFKVTEKWENEKNSEIVRKILQKDLSISTKRPS